MEFAQMVGRELEVRRRFAEYEVRTTGQDWTPVQLVQGIVVDVDDLMRPVMAKEGARRVADALCAHLEPHVERPEVPLRAAPEAPRGRIADTEYAA
jgi:hypothetical protein